MIKQTILLVSILLCLLVGVVVGGDTFGASSENSVNLLDRYSTSPRALNISNPLLIRDGKAYRVEWKVANNTYNTASLYIETPFSGTNSFQLIFSVYDVLTQNMVFRKNAVIEMDLPILSTTAKYSENLSFLIRPVTFQDVSNKCKVGIVTQKVSSLKELTQFKNFTFVDIPCNSNSQVKVPYFGSPYTKFMLTYDNSDLRYISSNFSQREEFYSYFPTFHASLANGTDIHLVNSDNTLSFSSVIHSNIPVLDCKADLVIGKVTYNIYHSNCSDFINFSVPIPPQSEITTATLIIYLSNSEYFFEEKESIEFDLVKCSLSCQNGGVCVNSTISGAYCKCTDLFVGEYCQNCKEGFTLQFGKCACPPDYQQVGNECVKGDSGDTSCFGKNRTDSFVCSGQGNCTSFNLCKCNQGFSGQDCSLPICFGQVLNVCNGNGQCTAPDVCKCNETFGGLTCEIAKCNGLVESEGGCSFHGSCNPNTHLCECSGNFMGSKCSLCKEGFTGAKCDVPICYGISAIDSSSVCNGNGKCTAPGECQCNSNYYGPNCASFKCNGIEKTSSLVCSSNGYCTSADICSCNSNFDSTSFCSKCLPSFNGSDCSTRICNPETTCKGHGQCNEQLECVCNGKFTGSYCEKCQDGWVGDNCDIQCSSQSTCSGKGTCSSTGSCICSNSHGEHCETCNDGWYGDRCDFNMDLNSFEFNENGDTITAKVVSVFKKNIDCSSLIVNTEILGESPSCSLDSGNSLLTIKLGAVATIVIGGNLKVRNYIDSSSTSNVKVLGTNYKKVDPVAYLTSEKSVIGCGSMFLDASSSSSLDRRRLIFTFSATLAPNSDALSALNSLISGTSASTVKFNVDNLPSGTYAVQVTVQSSFSGRISYASYSFTVTDSSPPNLSIKNGISSSVTIGSPFIATPVVTFPSCYGGNPSLSSLKFTYTQLSGPIVQIKQLNELLVFNSDYTRLVEEGKYVFSLKAQQDGYPAATTTFEIVATALPLKVSFNIRDMSQSMEDNIKFTVSKQDPSNPEDSTGLVTLSCVNLETLQDCPGFTSGTNIDQSSLTFNQKYGPGSYLFTTVYSKGSRSSSSKVKIVVTNQSKSTFLRVYISAPTDVELSAIDPSKDLILQAQSLDTLSSQRTFSWSTNFDSSIDTSKKYLTIPKKELVAGASYSVSVKVVDGEKVGEAVISFLVNAPPTLGILDVNPSTGVALADEFKISCGNGWSDSQLPLTFKFLFRQQGETFWKVLKERSETRSFSTVLTSGDLEIKAIVYDALGASTETVKTVKVTDPVDISQAVQSLSAISSATITSSSVSTALSFFKKLQTKSQTEDQKQALIETTSKIALAYFNQAEKEESVTTQTVTSTSSSISVISSVSSCVESLPESTVGIVINKFKSTMDGASSKLVLPDEDIESSLSSATAIQAHVVKNKGKRSISLFTQDQVDTMDQIKETLMNLKLKNFVADMPAARTFGADSYSYVRLLSISSLSTLNDNVNNISSFALSSDFSAFPQFDTLENVKVAMKVQSLANSLTKLFTFKVVSSSDNSEISISSDSIAKLTIEFNDGVGEQLDAYYYCNVMKNGKMEKSESCKLISRTDNTKTIEVSSTGSFAIIQGQDYNIDIPTSWAKLEYIALITLIVPVIAVIIIVIVIIICCVRRKRKNNEKKKQMNTSTV